MNKGQRYIDDISGIDLSQLRMMTNLDQDIFRYGLQSTNENSYYEDPTFLGFTVEIDEESALFTDAREFIERNQNHNDIRHRLKLYDNFTQLIKMVFNSQESAGTDASNQHIKQHYINSISGLQSLTKKFVKFKEDKLTVELYEDIALFSTYLATTYNNLVFSYETGRVLIPENLMYFNLYIKISEIRNLTSLRKLASSNLNEVKLARAIKRNTTCMVYKLTDCLFNFFEATPFGDQIAQSGIDTPFPAHSIVTFDMYFKRVNLMINAPLVPGGVYFDNRDAGLALKDVSINKEDTPYNTEDTPQRDVASPDETQEKSEINQDISANNTDKQGQARSIYNKEENETGHFINAGNKRASGFGELDGIGELNLENDYSNFEAYQKELEKLKEFNTSSYEAQALPGENETLTDIDSVKLSDNTAEGDGENIQDETGDGKENFESPKKESEKNLWMETKDTIDKIRSGNNAITDFYKQRSGAMNDAITNTLGPQMGGIVSGAANTVTSTVMQTLQKYERLLMNKKNEMINQFVDEVKTQGKILLDYNVYTDPDDPMWTQPLQELYDTMGNNVVDQLIGSLKDGTNTNVFGTGSTGPGL